ncbi:MAG: hypothetical protein H6853_06115 [Rhodospirillales bacterium]|nr:hypothetical protein [Alphaproteobacteria bacterium]USO03115.1 MAG: hypothetical protein H6853_06115 [Rhodospirillales bacterium]
MVGLVNSGIQQQIPAANTFQPGNNETARQANEVREDSTETRPTGTAAAKGQETETRNNGHEKEAEFQASANQDTERSSGSSGRGSVVDITV